MTGIQLRASLWLLLALLAALACAAPFLRSDNIPLQTNLMALLPPTERNPVAEQAVTKLADAAGDRVLFLVGHAEFKTASTAARTFAKHLDESGAFRKVVVDIAATDPKQILSLYQKHRFSLLSDADRQALQANTEQLSGPLSERLQRKLYAPFQFGLQLSVADDPFGLTDSWLAALPLKNLKLEPQDGLLVSHSAGTHWVLVTAELPGSAYETPVQAGVKSAVAAAEGAIHTMEPHIQLLRAGTVFYAESARASAEREMDLIGAGSVAGMLLMLYLVFRSLRPLALGVLSVGFGITAAMAATLWVYGEMHLITLVFGASLIGEAIDYAIQYFAAHMGAGPSWEPMTGLRRIAPGLTVALATSLLGYAALMLAPFPALSQIALFALVGLSAAWLSVFLLLPALLKQPYHGDPQARVAIAQRLLLQWQRHMGPRACIVLAGGLLLLAAPGWWLLQGNDDVRLLITRPATLLAQENAVRELTGLGGGGQFFLVEGSTPNEVLLNEERLASRLAQAVVQKDITAYQSLSAMVPSAPRQLENRTLWKDKVFSNPAQLRSMFSEFGLREDVANQQLVAFEQSAPQDVLTLQEWLASPMSTPYRHLWLGSTQLGFASIVLPQGVLHPESLKTLGVGLPGVTYVDKADSVSQLFRSYRQWGAVWLIGALCLVYAVLWLRYGARQAAVVLAPTLLAIALTLGIFGYVGVSFTLFNLMGMMLVLGVGVNYAIFLREGGVKAAATLAGVLLSAATTLLSFGLLAFSSMPVLAGFGLTLLIGVGMAVVLAPMVLSFAFEKRL